MKTLVLTSLFLGLGHAAPQPVVSELRAFYPGLGPEAFRVKLAGATDAFRFFRTFVPYFYAHIDAATDLLGDRELLAETGWCAGDAHPENFGTLLGLDAKASFTLNDPDDAGPCPLHADFLRLLTALRLDEPRLDLRPVLDAYGRALSSGKTDLSRLARQLIAKADGKDGPRASDLEDDSSLRREDSGVELTARESSAALALFRRAIGPDAEIRDSFRYRKSSGGSGGLLRYRFLLREGVFELKEIQRPGIFPVAAGPIPSDRVRYRKTIRLEVGEGADASYGVRMFLGKSMFLRPRWKGNRGISLDDYTIAERRMLARDEAQVLGLLHRGTAKNPARYVAAFMRVAPDAWSAAASRMAQLMTAAFDGTR